MTRFWSIAMSSAHPSTGDRQDVLHDTCLDEDRLTIESIHATPYEEVAITFKILAQVMLLHLDDDSNFSGRRAEDLHQRLLLPRNIIGGTLQALVAAFWPECPRLSQQHCND